MKIQISVFLSLLICLSFGAGSTSQAAPPLETLLPADTGMAMVIKDVPGFLADWPESPWGRFWSDPESEEVKASLLSGLFETEEDKAMATAVLESLSGQAAVVVPDFFENVVKHEEGTGDERWALIAELTENSDLPEILAKEEKTLNVTTVNGITIFGEPETYVASLAKALGTSRGDKLSGTSTFRKMRERNPDSDSYFYMDLSFLSRMFEQVTSEGLASDPQAEAMGITPEGLKSALALDVWSGVYVACTHKPFETLVDMGILYSEERGVARFMSHLPGPVTKPEFIPEDALMASADRFSFSRFWDGLFEIAAELSPNLESMLNMQMTQMSSSLGIDLENDVFRNLGEDSFNAYLARPAGSGVMPEMDQVMGITVNDPDALMSALGSVTAMFGGGAAAGGMAVENYQGVDIHAFSESEEGGFSYALSGNYLLASIGSPHGLKTLIDGMQTRRPKSIWERKDLKPLFAELPATASSVVYVDMGALVKIWFDAALRMDAMDAGEADAEDDHGLEKLAKLRETWDWTQISRFFGPMIGASEKADGGLYSVARLIHSE